MDGAAAAPLELEGRRLDRATLSRHLRGRNPVKIKGLLEAWPAYEALSLESLVRRRLGASAAVQHGNIEQGPTVLSHVPTSQYLEHLTTASDPEAALAVGYLAQIDTASLVSDLDALFPIHDVLPRWRLVYRYFWIGPAGTVTGLHRDDSKNVLAQIDGSKTLILIPPSATPYLYRSPKYDPGAELSSVDAERPDLARHPLFNQVSVMQVRLDRGEMLYIPDGWWHQVRSLTPSVSISTFFQGGMEYLRTIPRSVLAWLHDAGVYRPAAGCICHSADGPRLRNN